MSSKAVDMYSSKWSFELLRLRRELNFGQSFVFTCSSDGLCRMILLYIFAASECSVRDFNPRLAILN